MNNLKNLRLKQKLTQKDIAKIINVAPTTYLGYEKGLSEPTIATLIKLANYFDVSLDYLCDRQWENKAYIEVWKLSDEQKANLYLIQQLNHNNNLRASGYLMGLLHEQNAGI